MELMKGVHVIETYATTTLLVDDRLVLIDTSADADGGKVLDYFAKIKMRPKDLSTIFITHTHPDHVGGLAAIKHGSPAKVASSRIEADFIARRRVYDGPPGVQRHPGTPVDVLLDDGQTHDGLRVIFTPGHTRGSMSLLDESRSLCIAGDAVNNESGLKPMPDQYNVDPKQHRASIKKLATFHFENVVMGHGTPIVGGASAKIAELAKRGWRTHPMSSADNHGQRVMKGRGSYARPALENRGGFALLSARLRALARRFAAVVAVLAIGGALRSVARRAVVPLPCAGASAPAFPL